MTWFFISGELLSPVILNRHVNVDTDVRYCRSCFIFHQNSIMQKNRVQGQRENNALVVEKKKRRKRKGGITWDIYVVLSVIELELHAPSFTIAKLLNERELPFFFHGVLSTVTRLYSRVAFNYGDPPAGLLSVSLSLSRSRKFGRAGRRIADKSEIKVRLSSNNSTQQFRDAQSTW